jgi:hypothetical protein
MLVVVKFDVKKLVNYQVGNSSRQEGAAGCSGLLCAGMAVQMHRAGSR